MNSKILFFIGKRLVNLTFAGVLIGTLHDNDLLVMFILMGITILMFIRKIRKNQPKIYYLGFVLTAIGGVLAEHWGIYNGLWKYHDLSHGRTFPLWLPFAWGLAFSFTHNFKSFMVQELNLQSFRSKLILSMLTAMFLPLIGEIITIQLGVWTYYGPYQILGVPLYAIFLLTLFHTSMFVLLTKVNERLQMDDIVFLNSKQLIK